MFKKIATLFCFTLCLSGYAQTNDSLKIAVSDSLYQKQLYKLDSVQQSTKNEFSRLKNEYDSIGKQFENPIVKLQHKTDSLNKLNLTTGNYTKKLDSLAQLREAKLTAVKSKTEVLKEGSIKKINDLKLPPEISKEAQQYSQGLSKLDITVPGTDLNFPTIPSLGKVPNLPMPGVNTSSIPKVTTTGIDTSIPQDIGEVTIPEVGGEIKQIGDQVKEVTDKIKDPPATEEVMAKAEEKVAESRPVKNATEKLGVPKDIPMADGQLSKEELKEEAKKQAVNHFAGKEAALTSAIDKMSKYKKKYDNVSSIKDLPKKRPNPMKEKPFVERLVPGITLQFQSWGNFLLDVNASAGYRWTERITTGLGWNQRWAYSIDAREFKPAARIYGVRSYGEYNLKKGFAFRADVECMNTFVKQSLIGPSETGQREWVWSAFTGVKQEYKIARYLKGNAQVMFNLFDRHHKSPYADRVNIRIGFEFSLKKKKKEVPPENEGSH